MGYDDITNMQRIFLVEHMTPFPDRTYGRDPIVAEALRTGRNPYPMTFRSIVAAKET
jgi:hypothetical protein